MSPRMLATAITLGALAAAILCFLPLLSRPGPGAFRPTARTNLKVLHVALLMYQDENGSLPADPRGPSYALYLLRDLLQGDATPFADPSLDCDDVARPRFDGDRGILVSSGFEYLNDPSPPSDDVVVFAELPDLNADLRYYVTLGGEVTSIDPRASPLANSRLVGLRLVGGKLMPLGTDAAEDAIPRAR